MTERIVALAKGIAGAEEQELPLLEALCGAAEQLWSSRLKAGMTPELCGEAFCCAAAFTAAADYVIGQDGSAVGGFSAGVVSVRTKSAADRTAMARALRQTAERLMTPYAEVEDFCFKGVWG